MQLSELTVRGFADLLGSDAPAPGGGSAAALAGALGAALTAMVGSLTVGKKKYAAVEESIQRCQQQANALAMEQNDLLDRQNSIAEKARRDANIAAAVGAVQRHNTNKAIKKWMEK